MTNRVLLNDSGLKISAPGFDVLTAGLNTMAFDSRFPMPKVYTTGAVGITLSNVFFASTGLVSYGKTFSRVPTVFYHVAMPNGLNCTRFAFRPYEASNEQYSTFASSIGLSGISFLLRSRLGANSRDSYSATIYYLVLDE